MIVALIVVAVILVGLPQVAWWVGNRRFWGRLRPSPAPVLQDDLRRRLGLTATELAQVQQAAGRGREFSDPRLRAATVGVAGQSLARTRLQWRIGIASGVCMAVAMALLVAEDWADNHALSSFIGAVAALNPVAQVVVQAVVRRRLRQAARLNSATVAGGQA